MTDQPELPAGGLLPRRGRPVTFSQRRSPQPVMPEQLVTALAVIQGYQGELADRLEKQNESSALYSATARIRPTGHWTRSWNVQYRSVAVANLSPAPITVVTGGPTSDTAPGEGPGTHVLLPGQAATYAMSGNAVTVYGRPGDLVDIQVFTRAQGAFYGYIGLGGIDTASTYTYDANGRVATETRAGMTVTYSYDGNGNITGVQ